MAELKVNLSLDSSKFVGGLNEAKSSVDGFNSESNEAQAALDKIDKKMNRQIDTAKTYSRRVMAMREAIVGYQITFNDLSEDVQNSDFGRGIQQRIEELTNEAGALQDVITETSTAIRQQADGEIMYQATIDGLDILATSMQTVIGVQGLLGGSTEKLQQAFVAMQTVQSAANMVTKTTIALQRDSAIAQALARAATSKNIIVTKAATVAQKAMNLAVKANPYIIAATALAALTVGIYKFITAETEAEKAQREFNESLKENYVSTYSDTLGSTQTQFVLLQAEWKKLKTEAEKTEWLDKNKTKLESLIGTVDSITTAENIFVNNTANVQKAFELRAKAAASAQILEEAYKKQIEETIKYEKMSDEEKRKYAKDIGVDLSKPAYSRKVDNTDFRGDATEMYIGSVGGKTNSRQKTEYIMYNINKRVMAEIKAQNKKLIEAAKKEISSANDELATVYSTLGIGNTKPETTKQPAKQEDSTIPVIMDLQPVGLDKIDAAIPDLSQIKLEPIDISPIITMEEAAREAFEKMMKRAYMTSEAIGSVGTMLGSIGDAAANMGNEGAAAMLKFGATALSSISEMIPAVTQLIGLKTSEAYVSAVATGAKAPWMVAIPMIAAIVGAVATTIAAIPKYADGGMIKGFGTIGDMNIARVNSGEMILNGRQQDNLWHLLNGEGRIEAQSFPTEIQWKLRGSDIYGSLSNYTDMKRKAGKNINF